MTIFSIVLIFILLIFLFFSKSLKSIYNKIFILAITLNINIGAGYFFKFGGNEVSFSEVITGVLVIISLVILLRVPLEKKVFVTICCLIMSIGIGILFLVFIPYEGLTINFGDSWDEYLYGIQDKTNVIFNSRTISMSIRVLIFTGLLLVNESIFTIKNWHYIIKYVVIFSKISIIWGFFEWITKNIFNINSMNYFTNIIFGIGQSTTTDLIMRDDTYALIGFSREPSGYALTLTYIALLIIVNVKINNDNIIWLYATLTLLFLSMSLSSIILGIMVITISILVFNITLNKTNVVKIIFALIIFISLSIYIFTLRSNDNNYYLIRLKNTLMEFQLILQGKYDNGDITSEKVRIISIVDTFKALLNRPFFGLGIGTVYSHSSIITILANIGVIGFFYWLKTIKKIGQRIRFSNFKFNITLVIFLFPFLFLGDFSLLYSLNIFPIIAGLKIVCNPIENYKSISLNPLI